ncbi:MAG: putative toxin-antitoxin system toxin component, PIN family [Deltaproteobacteria bacterium CG_4_8_14_3_um_filter_51_11]|nr:putative toxin-antitoxin system toxin component, PIN family [bacterium]OIP42795.1 MAG: putative toxin-antitoxin system toxin component, PIN family [Desulfobacteraceae bacterium CG2_30_51_40]PIP48390.1 MAG: putative toxin-antitoxin system toxin component, PIN family [Deltaproteobacteria bacterium CG23_combo_of_CG06-09_8_20_14_all_51_20]PIX19705.1 MAG: putative toxin-antitoxin system toxin component, PIN family [Deltaproteobacteria bacterium CG_4_8_14_3_um_filter_51_11]PIY23858.1 MAG: putative
MIVVIDANVAIAAVAARGLCEAVMELCLEHHEIVLCEGILTEIEEKLRDKIGVPSPIMAEYLQILRNNSSALEPEAVNPDACRDPKDLMILGLVKPGHVRAIITGDKDLLVLKEYAGAKILSPRAFWEMEKES